ncbi:MAG TPA: hypothetical protein VGH89_31690 [Pseudonocardia sp.]|jgi:hypothetical protein
MATRLKSGVAAIGLAMALSGGMLFATEATASAATGAPSQLTAQTQLAPESVRLADRWDHDRDRCRQRRGRWHDNGRWENRRWWDNGHHRWENRRWNPDRCW